MTKLFHQVIEPELIDFGTVVVPRKKKRQRLTYDEYRKMGQQGKKPQRQR